MSTTKYHMDIHTRKELKRCGLATSVAEDRIPWRKAEMARLRDSIRALSEKKTIGELWPGDQPSA